jgi:hypothetical protein
MYGNLKKVKLKDRAVIELNGQDNKEFLQSLVTNNVDLVSDNKSIYAALLSPQGKYLFDFIIFQNYITKKLSIDCEKKRYPELIQKLNLYKLRNKIDININNDITIYGIYGSDISKIILNLKMNNQEGSTKSIKNNIYIVDPRNKKLGIRIYIVKNNFSKEFDTILNGSSSELEYNRIKLKIPKPEIDLEIEKSFIIENNFEEMNCIDFNKGCYIGQENTARQKYRGTAKRKLALVKINGEKINNGTKIYHNKKIIGTMRSSCKNIGLASIRTDIYNDYKKNKLKIKHLDSEIEFL